MMVDTPPLPPHLMQRCTAADVQFAAMLRDAAARSERLQLRQQHLWDSRDQVHYSQVGHCSGRRVLGCAAVHQQAQVQQPQQQCTELELQASAATVLDELYAADEAQQAQQPQKQHTELELQANAATVLDELYAADEAQQAQQPQKQHTELELQANAATVLDELYAADEAQHVAAQQSPVQVSGAATAARLTASGLCSGYSAATSTGA